jgi:hypothetical protein
MPWLLYHWGKNSQYPVGEPQSWSGYGDREVKRKNSIIAPAGN